jgi:Ricin-type beta-trefoil lectin domain/Putative Ig domain
MHRISKPLAAVGAATALTLGLAAGTLALSVPANAATNLGVTLSASGSGASATWDSAGDPVLTVGTPSSTTFAKAQINSVPTAAPASAPSFDTNAYGAGSPRWVIQFANGDSLFGFPANAGLEANSWLVVPAASGLCEGMTHAQDDTYLNALAFIQNAGCGGNVTAAYIVADGDQAAGTSDTITNISYDGETLAPGADVVTVTSPGAQTSTVGTAIATLQIVATSSKGDAIGDYSATGLPAGLAISSTTGAITGTPTTAGSYTVVVTAIDNGGTKGTVSFAWTVNASGSGGTGTTTYSGNLRLVKMGYCLDDRSNSSTPGAVVQIWRCNGLSNQVWQVMSNGTIEHNSLCLDAKHVGTTNGTKVQLWTCTGANNQRWDTSGWRIHYNNPAASNEVLDDTGFGGSGTQQEIYTNNGGANQVWGTN